MVGWATGEAGKWGHTDRPTRAHNDSGLGLEGHAGVPKVHLAHIVVPPRVTVVGAPLPSAMTALVKLAAGAHIVAIIVAVAFTVAVAVLVVIESPAKRGWDLACVAAYRSPSERLVLKSQIVSEEVEGAALVGRQVLDGQRTDVALGERVGVFEKGVDGRWDAWVSDGLPCGVADRKRARGGIGPATLAECDNGSAHVGGRLCRGGSRPAGASDQMRDMAYLTGLGKLGGSYRWRRMLSATHTRATACGSAGHCCTSWWS